MKNIFYLFTLCFIFGIQACKDDDDDHSINYEICETCEEVIKFQSYQVDFFTTHKDYVVKLPVFETVTEQLLIKPEHLEGATFQTVTEQILVQESYIRHEIMDSTLIHIVVNAETDSIGEITCYHFYDEDNIIEEEVPAQYTTVTKEVITQQGTGATIPASYSTVPKKIIASPSEIFANSNDQLFKSININIPNNKTIREYLSDQFSNQGSIQCLEGNSYTIQE